MNNSGSENKSASAPEGADASTSRSLAELKHDSAVGNIAMLVAKTFSGLNENALKYLLPRWMNAYSGVVLRLVFGSAFFWILGWVKKNPDNKSSLRDKGWLLFTGAIVVFGYMYTLLLGLTYTTPISSSIFIGLQAACVYLMCLVLRTDRFSWGRFFGIVLGIGGALVCVLTQKESDVASNPLLGNCFCLMSTFLFSAYLIIEKKFLKRLSNATVSKYTFSGGAIMGIIVVLCTGKWFAPVLDSHIFGIPFLVLAFILIFPTSLSYLLTDIGLKNLPATVVALYSNWILIVAAIASYILGQDHFTWWQILSIALIIASVFFVEKAESSDRKKSILSKSPAPEPDSDAKSKK